MLGGILAKVQSRVGKCIVRKSRQHCADSMTARLSKKRKNQEVQDRLKRHQRDVTFVVQLCLRGQQRRALMGPDV